MLCLKPCNFLNAELYKISIADREEFVDLTHDMVYCFFVELLQEHQLFQPAATRSAEIKKEKNKPNHQKPKQKSEQLNP